MAHPITGFNVVEVRLCMMLSRRGFSVNAPHLWNDLPDNLRLIDSVVLFKRHLKTHLFKAAFSVYL